MSAISLDARNIISIFKLRIGIAITLCAVAGMAIVPGQGPGPVASILFALAVLLSSSSAGAFNQFIERDLDAKMQRTCNRPFVTGDNKNDYIWLGIILSILVVSVLLTAMTTNMFAAIYVFLGAFFYGVVYTVWLKRRTSLNIVIGGLSGSFAVLAGAAAVDTSLSIPAYLLALVLFLWTPPHFWSFAFIFARDYERAGVPMLPVVMDAANAAKIIFAHTLALVSVSLLPVFFGLGWIYLAGALLGGLYFLKTSFEFMQNPIIEKARTNFKASLLQLSILLLACILDANLL